jgi:hypothetical protein
MLDGTGSSFMPTRAPSRTGSSKAPAGRPADITGNDLLPVPAWPPLPRPGAAPAPGCARPARASPAGSQDRRGPPADPHSSESQRSPESQRLAGRAVLCVPWRTLAGWGSEPGELSRIGPVTAGVAHDLALAAAADVTCEWRVIVVGPPGRALAVTKVRRAGSGARGRGCSTASAAASGSGHIAAVPGVVGRVTLTIPAACSTSCSSQPPRLWRAPRCLRRCSGRRCGRGRRRSPPGGSGPDLAAAPIRRRALATRSRTRCGRSSKHATRHAGSRPAVSRPGGASRITPSPTAWAARRARATCRPNAPVITTSSTCRTGGSSSRARGLSPGPPRLG